MESHKKASVTESFFVKLQTASLRQYMKMQVLSPEQTLLVRGIH